jgi:WhiB family transcriptional regulator, redox-sensing transcriptional regulator
MNQHPTATRKATTRRGTRTHLVPPALSIGQWTGSAACVSADPAIFFPDGDQSGTEAKQCCASCPVRDRCRDYALAAREEFGVWGGLSEDERKAILNEADRRTEAGKPLGGVA